MSLNFKLWLEVSSAINTFDDLINSLDNEIIKLRLNKLKTTPKGDYFFKWLKENNLLDNKEFVQYSYSLISIISDIGEDLLEAIKIFYKSNINNKELLNGPQLQKTQSLLNSFNYHSWNFNSDSQFDINFINWLLQISKNVNLMTIINNIFNMYIESKYNNKYIFQGTYEDVVNIFNSSIEQQIERVIKIEIDFKKLMSNKDGSYLKTVDFNLSKEKYLNLEIGEIIYFHNTNKEISDKILTYRILKLTENKSIWNIKAQKSYSDDLIKKNINENVYQEGFTYLLENKDEEYNIHSSTKINVNLYKSGKKDLDEFRRFGFSLEQYNINANPSQDILNKAEVLLNRSCKKNYNNNIGDIIISSIKNLQEYKDFIKISKIGNMKFYSLYFGNNLDNLSSLMYYSRYIKEGFENKEWNDFNSFKEYINQYTQENKKEVIVDYLEYCLKDKRFGIETVAGNLDKILDPDLDQQSIDINTSLIYKQESLPYIIYNFCTLNNILDNYLLEETIKYVSQGGFNFTKNQFVKFIKKCEGKSPKEISQFLVKVIQKNKLI